MKPRSRLERIKIYLISYITSKDFLKTSIYSFIGFFTLLWVLSSSLFAIRSLFPEMDMALNSNCKRPLQNWDGRIMDIPIWYNALSSRPSYFNLNLEKDFIPSLEQENASRHPSRPTVIWATHHKTGTFLAKKLFSKICARMDWCCIFHVTRDSVHYLNNALKEEPVDAMGHNQWIWHPHELNVTNYYFIHFYRNPLKKIISGYNYHYEGTEAWTKKPLKYSSMCSKIENMKNTAKSSTCSYLKDTVEYATNNTFQAKIDHLHWGHQKSYETHNPHIDLYRDNNLNSSTPTCEMNLITRDQVFDFCSSVHLCSICCRREHEYHFSPIANVHQSINTHKNHYYLRKDVEYDFLCKHLGQVKNSLQDTLMSLPNEEGILVEAAIDYYENLRMAKLVNLTYNDPRALHLDLDYVVANYDEAMWKIMHHLRPLIPRDLIPSLQNELLFYDLDTSPLYRWSMSNPLVAHVTQKSNHGLSSSELKQVLLNSKEFRELYDPLLDLMHEILQKDKKN